MRPEGSREGVAKGEFDHHGTRPFERPEERRQHARLGFCGQGEGMQNLFRENFHVIRKLQGEGAYTPRITRQVVAKILWRQLTKEGLYE